LTAALNKTFPNDSIRDSALADQICGN